ncbi:hypothetical protein [Ureibacillus aquaedulcis]|uniref:Uncharacterized protein n=1 Tax=Ureibacillus aquaedulcis TaxID=3058421 RepID=A0ABT8GSQ9_9BACL|nr:hypothetical protein [Ureibacillus sp. BA0131]MDN4494457.1 hypothetical protein [Ureibacillus sp. BA0131]
MLKVIIQAKDKRLLIPIPYLFLNFATFIITSKWVNRSINKAITKDGSKFFLPEIERSNLKPLLKEISRHSGLILIDTKLKDGTGVKVKL